MTALYQVFFYVPESHKEEVKQAMFQAGAGKIGDYDQCSWEIIGTGQFRPLQNSNPFIGSQDCLEQVAEYRVEMVCEMTLLAAVIEAMKLSHPYEEPAYGVVQLAEF